MWYIRTHRTRQKPKHLLHLLRAVVLTASENVGFCTFGVAKFMYLGLHKLSDVRIPGGDLPYHCPKSYEPNQRIRWEKAKAHN